MLNTVRGSSVVIEIDTKNEDREYVNPDSVKIDILDPLGNLVVNAANMLSEEDVGFFSYTHDTSSDGILGPYTARITVIQGLYFYRPEPFVCFILDIAEVPSLPVFQGNVFQNNVFQT